MLLKNKLAIAHIELVKLEMLKSICEHSIEQRVIEIQNMKKEIVKQVVSTDDSSITGLTKKDIKFILDIN